MNNYNYGSSIISTNLRLDMDSNSFYLKKIRKEFQIELFLFCNGKRVNRSSIFDMFVNTNIYYAIQNTFKKKIENQFVFHKGFLYTIEYKVYELKDITRYKYKKTDIKIFEKRKKYLLKERINVIAT